MPPPQTAFACRCGCAGDTHLHYRPGTDCGRCGIERCRAYVPDDFTDGQAVTDLALAGHALAADHIAEDPMTTSEQPTFTQDDGSVYERVDPGELEDFDDVDATTIGDPGAAPLDGLQDGGQH